MNVWKSYIGLFSNGISIIRPPQYWHFCASIHKTTKDKAVRQYSSSSDSKTNQGAKIIVDQNEINDDSTIRRLDLAYDYDENEIVKVDTNKWKDLPSTLDLALIKKFPLFNIKNKPITENTIKSISMFEDGYKKIPSVRNILKETMTDLDREILLRWEARMINEKGKDKFEKYREGLLSRGDIIHQCIELYFRGEGPDEEHLVGVEYLWNSVIHVLKRITNVKMIESKIVHPNLCYQGVVDCVGMYKNKMVAIEFKTSTKPKLILSATRDDPLQVAAYLGALNFDEKYDFPHLDGALLVFAYPTGLPAHAHYLDRKKSEDYWTLWRKRLINFWRMQETK